MSRNQYTATVPVEIGVGVNSVELLAEVRFTYHPEQPDHWNKSIGTWEPGGGGEIEDVEIVSLRYEKQDADVPPLVVPEWLTDIVVENVDHDTLREAAEEDDGPDPDDARDRAIDDALTRRANGED